MQIQINSDGNIRASEKLAAEVRDEVSSTLDRFRDSVTRVEVHLADTNGDKGGPDDKRCAIEARLAGLAPATAVDHADRVVDAVAGAADKLARQLTSAVERRRSRG